jgi:hypothetical protein
METNADRVFGFCQFRNAQQIKDQQRELIQKRRQGRAPLTMDSPGIGPPPSAGVIPPMMYLHKNSVGSRRSEAVKQKVQGMRVSTSSEGYGRHNGLKVRNARHITNSLYLILFVFLQTAPVGPSRQSQQQQQQPAHAAQSSHIRTTAHPDDGQDEDELMQDDVPTAAHMESGYVYSGQRPSQPPSARHLPQTAHPGLGGYPQGYPAPRYVDGDHPDMTHESERRRSLNGYVQPGVGASTRARSPPAYPPGTAYGSAQPGYPPRLAQMSAVNGPPTAGLARGEYPPGTMYRPRQSSGYPSANGAGPSVRARSPGGRPIPGYGNGSFDVEREHFMEPFHLLYDAFIDSMHLRRDLESKIRRANDLVEAQEAELRRISGLRIEFERALDRLRKDQDLLGAHPPKQPGEHRGNTSPPPSGGSDAQRAPTAPQAESVERDREVAEMRRKLQQMERQPR